MTVSSARVQQLVVGDDVTLTHQIMAPKAYNAEIGLTPVLLNTGDTVNFFYPLANGTDLIGYPGIPVGSYPTSTFTVAIPGIIPAVGPTPERGTTTFLIGQGETVRAEITRVGPLKETHYLYSEVDILERGFPINPCSEILNLT